MLPQTVLHLINLQCSLFCSLCVDSAGQSKCYSSCSCVSQHTVVSVCTPPPSSAAMGQTSTKHSLCVVEALELLGCVCDAAEKVAASQCGKLSPGVFKQVAVLRATHQEWLNKGAQADELQGHQVLAVAAALQAFEKKLEWCQHKLTHHRWMRLAPVSSKQQAAHIIKVLAVAAEAHQRLSDTFELAILLSRQQQQQQHDALDQAQHLMVQQQQQLLTLQQQQLLLQQQQQQQPRHRESAACAQQEAAAHSDDNPATSQHNPPVAAGGAGVVPGAHQEWPEQNTQQLRCAPACPLATSSSGAPTGPESAATSAVLQECSQQRPSGGTADQGESGPSAAPDTTAETAEAEAEASETVAAAVPAAQDLSGVAQWEHSREGWQALLQRAWRGDAAAVLACAQELITGGDCCFQDFALARQLLHTVLHESCGVACLWLGQLCERGLGLPAPDYTEAAAWYGRGAAAGDLECAHALAYYYHHGLGVVQDRQAALEWYEFAAEGGLASAQNNLGQLLLDDADGETSNAGHAMDLLHAAADQGSSAAWYNLGVCYELGLSGCCPDTAAAEACFQQAGTGKALVRLGQLYQQQQDSCSAQEAFNAAAESGSAEAMLALAKIQEVQPQQLFVDDQQQQQQQCQVPLRTRQMQSVSSRPCGACGKETALFCQHASLVVSRDRNSSNSNSNSSSMLARRAAAETALQLYQQAAEAGVAEAQHVVGQVWWGQGRVNEAMHCWHAAAAQGYGPALLCLAAAADKGLQGVKKDPAAARACYAMAAACGSHEGEAELEMLNHEAALNNSWNSL